MVKIYFVPVSSLSIGRLGIFGASRGALRAHGGSGRSHSSSICFLRALPGGPAPESSLKRLKGWRDEQYAYTSQEATVYYAKGSAAQAAPPGMFWRIWSGSSFRAN